MIAVILQQEYNKNQGYSMMKKKNSKQKSIL